jgi:peptidoglycan hydrolase-like protein with peptidoglycan-binding domain
VSTLQRYLISQSLLSADSATGYFGALTEKAVQTWQKQHNIVTKGTPSTTGFGVVGKLTKAALARCNTNITVGSSSPATTTLTTVVVSGGGGGGGGGGGSSCTPLAAQTQTLSCSAGQSGSITQTRTSSCPGPVWSNWQTTGNTCATQSNTSCSFAG